jgi:PAS domain S-box-containing protein
VKRRGSITTKLTIVLVLFAAVILLGMGFLIYASGRAALESAAISALDSTALEKQAALEEWVADHQSCLISLVNSPALLADMVVFTTAPPDSAEAHAAHDRIVQELKTRIGPGQGFMDFLVIEPLEGEVVIATDPAEEGKFKEDREFFTQGKQDPFVQNPYYSLSVLGATMTASAPFRTADGKLLGVLAGRMNLSELDAIITRRSDLHQSEDAYLANSSNLFVTQPRFISDSAVLQLGARTEADKRCLMGTSGVLFQDDYRGVPVIAVYRWLPERELCLVVKLDQAEALAPIRTYAETIAIFSILALLGASLLAIWLARAITHPLQALQASVARFGAGELDMRIPAISNGEVGELANEFNKMADSLQQRIIERQRAEEALRVSEERFALAVRGSDAGLWDWNIQNHTLYWSPRLKELLGYADDKLDVNFDTFESHLHPDDREHTRAAIEAHLKDRGLYDVEQRLRTKSGEYRWFSARGQALWDEAGNPLRMVGSITDITKRKQAEEHVRRNAARAEALARIAARLNAQLDLDTVLKAVCEETARALNVPMASVTMYDEKSDMLYPAAGFGLSGDVRQRHPPTPRTLHDEYARRMGPVIVIPDAQALPDLPATDFYAKLDIRTIAVATMLREGKLIGTLNVATTEVRHFTADELALLQGLGDQAAQAIVNARLFQEAKRRLAFVQALRSIDTAITASLDLQFTFKVILDQVTTQLGVDAADVLLLNPHIQTLEYAAGQGFRSHVLQHTNLRVGDGYAGRAALERRIVSIPHLEEAENGLRRATLLPQEEFVSYYAVPLIAKGQAKGVLEIFHRARLDPDPEWLGFLETLAGQAAIAIDNATLVNDLQRSNIELALAYDTTLEGWAKALELRDRETEGHTRRVTEMTLAVTRAMGMSEAELVHVRRGALLHDIGKIAISDTILLKPGPLTDEEWEIMHQHPVYACELLSPIAYLRPALDIPHCHHEKWDGTGYPRGLKGEQIPLAARIFAVMDVWDALLSDRPYRAAWPEEKALEYIREQAGKHFDPQVVKAFFEVTM